MSERLLELQLLKEVKNLGGFAFKFNSPSMAGVPDRIVILPKGKIWLIELKSPKGGRLSRIQKNLICKLEELETNVRVIGNSEQLKRWVQEVKNAIRST